jgi:hypothetical protein
MLISYVTQTGELIFLDNSFYKLVHNIHTHDVHLQQ